MIISQTLKRCLQQLLQFASWMSRLCVQKNYSNSSLMKIENAKCLRAVEHVIVYKERNWIVENLFT